jgi:IS5 family transposase
MEVPKQRNTKEENKMIKDGEIEQVKKEWSPEKSAQKDTDARWTKKHGKNYFGFKMHTSVDVKHKFIRKFTVTPANVHDSQEFMNVLSSNTNVDIYGDSAYRSQEDEELMKEYGFRSKIQYKGSRSKPLTEKQRETNSIRAKVRARVEHVFGTMRQCMGSTLIRSVGLVRAKKKIGLSCLAYNFKRFTFLSGDIV